MFQIEITWPDGKLTATLRDTPSTRALLAATPFETTANLWGEEVYCATPSLKLSNEPDARQIVEPGEVCYWLGGDSLALPWGRTPISKDARPCLVEACNVLGKVDGDPRQLARIPSGAHLHIRTIGSVDAG